MKRILLILAALHMGLCVQSAPPPMSKADRIRLIENSDQRLKSMAAGCAPAAASTELDVNNVRALIHTGGDMWWDLVTQSTAGARYEVPAGSGKMALFAGSIWIGGTDVNGQLRLCAQRFRQLGYDYWPGPLIETGSGIATVSADICKAYDKHFVITRQEVEEFHNYMQADEEQRELLWPDGYTVPTIIKEWPAHSTADMIAQGYPKYLAPFKDVDGDGEYNYENGDYPFFDIEGELPCGTSRENRQPRLFGDKSMWWVYNDKGNIHTESGGTPIGMELRAQAFGFATNDELNNMTFYNYNIINRSTFELRNTYFGVWTDADLGKYDDDYVGCDVNRGLGYLYNGNECDGGGSGQTYGCNPPAVGVDFFEGPYQDPDGIDNLSSWPEDASEPDCQYGYGKDPSMDPDDPDNTYGLRGNGDIANGSINGLNFGDGIVDNERWGMRRFLYFNSCVVGPKCDPHSAQEYYNYLRGIWRDGQKMCYGGDGYNCGTDIQSDFMFPGETDPCDWGTGGNFPNEFWSEENENNSPADRRFVQSAGPFTLEPGAINDITTGVVWARSTASQAAWASVASVQKADDKAQRLFESCFKIIDGPDAPELEIVELDGKLVFHIYNRPQSNNYLEKYAEVDNVNITCPEETACDTCEAVVTDCDKTYRFQGYQVFQVENENVSVGELYDENKARLVFQCDIKDGVEKLVNYTWSDEKGANDANIMVDGADKGIRHTFEINTDQFAVEDKNLVNHKEYHYIAIAYAYNEYKKYDQTPGSDALDGQTEPYLAGRKSVDGAIKTYTGIPHIRKIENGGITMNGSYRSTPEITMLEGYGGLALESSSDYSAVWMDLSDETLDEIMANNYSTAPTYKKNHGPIGVFVYNPLLVPNANFRLGFMPDSVNTEEGHYSIYGAADTLNVLSDIIIDAKWFLAKKNSAGEWADTVYSDYYIGHRFEQTVDEWGLSVDIQQQPFPGNIDLIHRLSYIEKGEDFNKSNGFVHASIQYQDSSNKWLEWVYDTDEGLPNNWIRVGKANPDALLCEMSYKDYLDFDNEQVYESVLEGTWAPYILTSQTKYGPVNPLSAGEFNFDKYRVPSIDIVITPDQSKWTRCVVVEMNEDENSSLSEGGANRFSLRQQESVGKDGLPDGSGTTGMGWFPGYAIDVEKGCRLNIIFGENSWLSSENGDDLIWNPSHREWSDLVPDDDDLRRVWFGSMSCGELDKVTYFGGQHYIYVMAAKTANEQNYMPYYDEGQYIYEQMSNGKSSEVFKHAAWVSIPLVKERYVFDTYEEMPDNEVTIKIRVANPYMVGTGIRERANPENQNYPLYEFTTEGINVEEQQADVAESALDLIRAVPNPYYGHNEYEQSQTDNFVKITNLPESCTVSIYMVNGVMVRQFEKDNDQSYILWDLKNEYGIAISSGVYIIHIDAPGIGEKTIKWFGSLRPMDISSF